MLPSNVHVIHDDPQVVEIFSETFFSECGVKKKVWCSQIPNHDKQMAATFWGFCKVEWSLWQPSWWKVSPNWVWTEFVAAEKVCQEFEIEMQDPDSKWLACESALMRSESLTCNANIPGHVHNKYTVAQHLTLPRLPHHSVWVLQFGQALQVKSLLGGFNPIEIIRQIGSLPQIGVKIKNVGNGQLVLTLYMLQILHHEIPWEYLLKIQKLGNDVWWRTDELHDLNIFQKWPCLDSTSQQGMRDSMESTRKSARNIMIDIWLTKIQEVFSCTFCKEWNNATLQLQIQNAFDLELHYSPVHSFIFS